MYNPKIKTSFLDYVFGTSGLKKLVLIFDCTILYPWKAVYNYTIQEITIPVSLRNRLISGGLEPVLSHTGKITYNIVLYLVFYEYKNVQS